MPLSAIIVVESGGFLVMLREALQESWSWLAGQRKCPRCVYGFGGNMEIECLRIRCTQDLSEFGLYEGLLGLLHVICHSIQGVDLYLVGRVGPISTAKQFYDSAVS